jgi:predicted enzyme related to lactoylglutathione lyase
MAAPAAMVYVRDVFSSLAFYEAVFGVARHHADDDGSYGEFHLGETRVGFVADWHATRHLVHPFRRNDHDDEPAAFELYFTVPDVDAAFARALQAGAVGIVPPTEKPWGRAAILRDPDGVLFELGDARA